MSSKRFRELQAEFFATSVRLRATEKSEEKLALLNELQRIVQESKRALVETDSKKSGLWARLCLAIAVELAPNRVSSDG